MSVTMPWKASRDSHVNGVASKIDEVRNALTKEADRLAEMAAQYGRDASAHASNIADDASTQAGKLARDAGSSVSGVSNAASDQVARAGSWANDLAKAAAGVGTALALSSRKTAQDLGDNAQSLTKDLRNLRITTEPKKTGPDYMPGITLLAGFGAGIALLYFLDPERGRSRRNLLRSKVAAWTRKAGATAQQTRKQLQGQMMRGTDGQLDLDSWSAHATENDSQSSDLHSPTDVGATDGSTTDTWGEQPQPSTPSSTVG